MIAILISIALGLLVNECCEVSPWCADKLVRWSAYCRYKDPVRAAGRAEEFAALIRDRPGKLLKLFSALGFAASAVFIMCRRQLARRQAVKAAREHTEPTKSNEDADRALHGPLMAALAIEAEYAAEAAPANFQLQNMMMSTYAAEQNALQDTLCGIAQSKEQQDAAIKQAQEMIVRKIPAYGYEGDDGLTSVRRIYVRLRGAILSSLLHMRN